jgi:uncharacterized protein YndB with AHSA1/START domain
MTKITIESIIAASSTKVWDYWTNPHHITKWNFASSDWQCPRASNDLRVGGKYSARMEAKDGSFGFDFDVIYTEVVLKKRLSYRMEDGREATTTFESVGESTKVVTVFDAEKTHSEQMQRDGWQAILDNFKAYTESH